jgi:hypothetical protein
VLHLIFVFALSFMGFSEEIIFTIQPGTSEASLDWNDSENPLIAKVGDTLTIINEDSVVHQLHTPGRPCKHGEPIPPQGSWSCVLEKAYNYLDETEPLRDHQEYDSKFWLIVESTD